MAQVGVLSMSQLQLHDHYDINTGGIINATARVASATAKMVSPNVVTTGAGIGAWAVMKRIVLREDSTGTMNIVYTLTRTGGAGTVHAQARIYRGTTGALLWSGVDNSTAAGPTVYTDAAVAIDLLYGDRVEVWGYVSAGALTTCTLEQQECQYDGYITLLSRRALNAALLLTAASDVLYTAVL